MTKKIRRLVNTSTALLRKEHVRALLLFELGSFANVDGVVSVIVEVGSKNAT
jgi:hypothetical protein